MLKKRLMQKRMSLVVDTIDLKPQLDAALINKLRGDNILAPSTSSWTSSSRRNSCIEDHITGATRGMQMLNFLWVLDSNENSIFINRLKTKISHFYFYFITSRAPALDDHQYPPGSPTAERRRKFLFTSRSPSLNPTPNRSRRNSAV